MDAPIPSVRVDAATMEAIQRMPHQQGMLRWTPTCTHCWHTPRVWQGPLPPLRHCCWCGVHERPPHGPYAEGG